MHPMRGFDGVPETEEHEDRVLERLGDRLARRRIQLDLSQVELAEQSGVSRPTVQRLEAGGSTQLKNLVRVLRVLELLPNFEALVPEADVQPLLELERRGTPARQRVSPRSAEPEVADAEIWVWGEDA